MGREKAELRAAAVHELGAKLDDALDAATADFHRLQGKVVGSREAMSTVVSLARQVSDLAKIQKLSKAQQNAVVRWLEVAAVAIEKRTAEASLALPTAQGRMEGLTLSVRIARSAHAEEIARGDRERPVDPLAERRT